MPSSFTPELRFTLQADGENPTTWGDIANTDFQLIEQAIAGIQTIPLSSGTTTLTTNNGATDQARAAILLLSGALGAANTVVIPNVSKTYVVYNNTTNAFSVTIQTAAPTSSVVVPQGSAYVVFCDGNNNVISISSNAVTLGGVSASGFAQLAAAKTNLFASQNAWTPFAVAFASPIVLNLANGNVFETTLTGNTTLNTPTNPADGQLFFYALTQNATGGNTVGFNTSWLTPSGLAPTIDPTPNATSLVMCMYLAALAKVVVLAVFTGYNGTAVSSNIVISQNTTNLNLFQLCGSPAAAVNVTLTINTGVRVIATDPQAYAIDMSGFTTGSVITLINNGYILGRGGNGGRGGGYGRGGTTLYGGFLGRNGGSAINGPGSGCTLNITNAGFIWGGGGGGGGGGANNPGGGTGSSDGGGGGGGAGGSLGGDGAQDYGSSASVGAQGGDGTWVTSGANGAGGIGGGTSAGSAGGNGGDWGTAGSAGTNGSLTNGGAAGTAGKAVNKNSATVNFLSGGAAPNVKGAVS